LIVPTIEKVYIVNNGCADAITVKNTGGTGIAVPAGKTMYVYNDGTNVVDAITHLTSLTLGTPLSVASGGTGSNTGINLQTSVAGVLPVANGGTGSNSATFSGANITALNATAVSSGTLDNARTTASSSNGASTIVARDASGNFSANVITADGSALTALNASNISSGTLTAANGGTGITSVGTAGNVLTSNGTAWTSVTPAVPSVGGILDDQTISTSSTYTLPTGGTYSADDYVYFFVTGGGGSGGVGRDSAADTVWGLGGNSGTTVVFGIRYDNCPATGAVTIGAGGTAVTRSTSGNSNGNNGNTTSIVLNSQTYAGGGGSGGTSYALGGGASEPIENPATTFGSTIIEQAINLNQGNKSTNNMTHYVTGGQSQSDARSARYGVGVAPSTTGSNVSKGACAGGTAYMGSNNIPITSGSGRSFISDFDNGGGGAAAASSGDVTATAATKTGGGGGGACGRATVTSGAGFAGGVRVIITKGQINDPILLLHDTAIMMARLFY
jgi:hypothetical protein